jgi:pimeloyl-ACP methyl ester carboxylesterase
MPALHRLPPDLAHRLLGAASRLGLATIVGVITTSALAVPHAVALPPAVPGEPLVLSGAAGPMTVWVAGHGSPVLLIHSINAAASAHEMRPLFERLARTHRVYAPDLPGFGLSDRSDRRYDIRLYVDAIHDALDLIARHHGDDVPVDAVALSLSAEFLARAALERPQRLHTLTLITPTGFARGSEAMRGPVGASREFPGVHAVVTVPLWAQALYDALVSRRSIAYFLRRTWGSPEVDPSLVDQSWATAHQPGARHAPFAFLSARLFARDVRTLYESLTLPVWVPHGDRGDFADFSESAWTHDRPNWRLQRFPAGAMVHWELPDEIADGWRAFAETVPCAD